MTLVDAIQAVEAAQANLVSADAAQATAQQKYEAALAVKVAADGADADAVAAFNASIDVLIEAAQAAKVNRTQPAP
jgi:hypothetical protein